MLLVVGRQVVPQNIVQAAADSRWLSVTMFAIVVGLALAYMGERAAPVLAILSVFDEVFMLAVRVASWYEFSSATRWCQCQLGRKCCWPLGGGRGRGEELCWCCAAQQEPLHACFATQLTCSSR